MTTNDDAMMMDFVISHRTSKAFVRGPMLRNDPFDFKVF
jgi:hypothetical protein